VRTSAPRTATVQRFWDRWDAEASPCCWSFRGARCRSWIARSAARDRRMAEAPCAHCSCRSPTGTPRHSRPPTARRPSGSSGSPCSEERPNRGGRAACRSGGHRAHARTGRASQRTEHRSGGEGIRSRPVLGRCSRSPRGTSGRRSPADSRSQRLRRFPPASESRRATSR
jgi:hypothetical protein